MTSGNSMRLPRTTPSRLPSAASRTEPRASLHQPRHDRTACGHAGSNHKRQTEPQGGTRGRTTAAPVPPPASFPCLVTAKLPGERRSCFQSMRLQSTIPTGTSSREPLRTWSTMWRRRGSRSRAVVTGAFARVTARPLAGVHRDCRSFPLPPDALQSIRASLLLATLNPTFYSVTTDSTSLRCPKETTEKPTINPKI
jgi:hypothetical protein